jgi:hypothetical protein
MTALYDLEQDMGETTDLSGDHRDVVSRLEVLLAACREDLGDDTQGVTGRNIRPAGRVDHPEPLTHYDPEHPYIMAMYDKEDFG